MPACVLCKISQTVWVLGTAAQVLGAVLPREVENALPDKLNIEDIGLRASPSLYNVREIIVISL